MTILANRLARMGSGSGLSAVLRVIQVLLLLIIGWVLVRAILLMTNPESAWTSLPNVSPITTSGSGETSANYNFTGDPFRLATTETQTSESGFALEPGFDVPETTLNLVLKGRTVGNPGSAVLLTPDNKERSYRVGDEVMNGVTLQSVSPGFIVLSVRGDLQRLTFAREEVTALGEGRLVEGEEASSIPMVAPSTITATPSNGTNRASAADLMKSVRLNPQFKQGKLIGHAIKSRGNEAVLKQFGLRSGDIVTAVNGESLLQGRLDLQELTRTLQSARQVQLKIIRDGRSQTVQIGQ